MKKVNLKIVIMKLKMMKKMIIIIKIKKQNHIPKRIMLKLTKWQSFLIKKMKYIIVSILIDCVQQKKNVF